MDFKKLKQLPRISRPRTGQLKAIPKSSATLTEKEEKMALFEFNRYAEVDQSGKFKFR